MDPQATLIRLLELLAERNIKEARYAFEDLTHWINNGGFVPAAINKAIEALRD